MNDTFIFQPNEHSATGNRMTLIHSAPRRGFACTLFVYNAMGLSIAGKMSYFRPSCMLYANMSPSLCLSLCLSVSSCLLDAVFGVFWPVHRASHRVFKPDNDLFHEEARTRTKVDWNSLLATGINESKCFQVILMLTPRDV